MKWRKKHPGYGCHTTLVPRVVRAWLGTEWGSRTVYDHVTEHVHSHYYGWCYCGREVLK